MQMGLRLTYLFRLRMLNKSKMKGYITHTKYIDKEMSTQYELCKKQIQFDFLKRNTPLFNE